MNVKDFKNVKTVKIGEIEFKLPYYDLLPPLTPEKYAELKQDISVNGVLVPIIIDEYYNVIDGDHRTIICSELKMKEIPFQIRASLTEEQKKRFALDLNLHRRHLPIEQIESLIIKYRQEGQSLRQIGNTLGVSHETVRRVVNESTVNDLTVEMPQKITGKDGKQRPSKKPCVNASTLKELQRATNACQIAGDNLPGKTIELKRVERIARQTQSQELREQEYDDYKASDIQLLLGDFNEKGNEIADESVDVIFTDPPYPKEFLPIWEDLGRFSKRVLKPGGLLITYSGNLYLPQIYGMLGNHLEYLWTAAILHSGGKKLVSAVKVQQCWKPILIYGKSPMNKYWAPFNDIVSGGQSKAYHPWEQSVDEAAHYIKALCPVGGTLVDPMMGSGTSIIGALTINKNINAIGIEIDKAAFATAQKRIEEAKSFLNAGQN